MRPRRAKLEEAGWRHKPAQPCGKRPPAAEIISPLYQS
ncbi:hypothetical protein KP77_30270 [Jeotgalibacillus alimentarius]|uniref:Uncharacterized protein n=1 Tax=Jeotgalibacillus alimentarius TaxID=135826 RepID=A0A0C2VJA8_9BACL|nr:hypothetical protein KP77_30270 [Jeotgalibacillus alimentarius]